MEVYKYTQLLVDRTLSDSAQARYLRCESSRYADGMRSIHWPMPTMTVARMSSATSRKRCAATASNTTCQCVRNTVWQAV